MSEGKRALKKEFESREKSVKEKQRIWVQRKERQRKTKNLSGKKRALKKNKGFEWRENSVKEKKKEFKRREKSVKEKPRI